MLLSSMFKLPEYKHLLVAERAITSALECKETDASDIAQLSRALVAVIDQKRVLRMQPAPKPMDVSGQPKRGAKRVSGHVLDVKAVISRAAIQDTTSPSGQAPPPS